MIWHHSAGDLTFLRIAGYGFLGVDLFFVISGFLIVTLLLRERDTHGVISLKYFYIRRSLRIFPVYYGFILALAAFYAFVNTDSEIGRTYLSELPIYLLYLANFIPVSFAIVWSLASEEQFYLLWPFLEKFFRKHIFLILIAALCVNQCVNFFHVEITDWLGVEDSSIFQTTFTPILLGVCLAHLLHEKSSFSLFERIFSLKHGAALWIVAIVLTCSLSPGDITGLPRLSIQVLMALLVGSVVANEKNSLVSLLCIRPVARIGAISYGIYLFHIHGIVVAQKVIDRFDEQSKLAVFVLAYVVTVVVAEISYRWYEAPILRLKSRFSIVRQDHA